MTNREKLSTMTNEEIVAFLSESSESICPFSCPPEHAECSDDCRGCWLEWLNKETAGVQLTHPQSADCDTAQNQTNRINQTNRTGVEGGEK